jgi:hypothetical protein
VSTVPAEAITAREREGLAKLVRLNEKVAKAAAKQRQAELRAEFEAQLAAEYSFDDHETWKAAKVAVDTAIKTANEQIRETCATLGIPNEFAPSLGGYWSDRGQNSTAKRRAELTKVAVSRIEERYRSALTTIEAKSAEVQTRILVGGLTSEDARAFVESIPSAAALMPTITLGEIEAKR